MYRNYEELLKKLEAKGMNIQENDIKYLEEHGYSYLLHNFGNLFLNEYGNYNDTKISDIISLSNFDQRLSSYIWNLISVIERKIKSVSIEAIGKSGGEFALHKKCIYSTKLSHENRIKNIQNIAYTEKLIVDSNSQRRPNNLTPLPVWEIINEMTFGNIIFLVKCLDNNIVSEIIKKVGFGNQDRKKFIDALFVIKGFRNKIGHHKPIINGIMIWKKKNEIQVLWEKLCQFDVFKEIKREIYSNFVEGDDDEDIITKGMLSTFYKIKKTTPIDDQEDGSTISDDTEPKGIIEKTKEISTKLDSKEKEVENE